MNWIIKQKRYLMNRKHLPTVSFKHFFIIVLFILLIYEGYHLFIDERSSILLIIIAFSTKLLSISYFVFYCYITISIIVENKKFWRSNYRKGLRTMKKILQDTEIGPEMFFGKLLHILLGIIALVLFFAFDLNFILFLLLIPTITLIWLFFRLNSPPAIIYLSSSQNENNLYNHNNIKLFIAPIRIVTLLEYNFNNFKNQNVFNKLINSTRHDILRKIFEDDWRKDVMRILDIVKIIIVDTSYSTTCTIGEVELIVSKDEYLQKTFFLTDKRGNTPLLDITSYLWNEDTVSQRRVGVYSDLFKFLKSKFHDNQN